MKLKLDEINPKLVTVILFLDALWVIPETNTLSWIFIILAHRTNIPQVDMSLYSDI
jgi:hypothetical protein